MFLECSAKTAHNIEESFILSSKQVLNNIEISKNDISKQQGINLTEHNSNDLDKECKC